MMETYFAIKVWGLYIGLATLGIFVIWALVVMFKDAAKERRKEKRG